MFSTIPTQNMAISSHIWFTLSANIETQILPVIDRQQALIVLTIPRDFQRDLEGSGTPVVQVIADGRNSNTAGIAQGYVGTILMRFMDEWRTRRGLAAPAVQLTMRAWFNPNLETRWNMIPSLIGTITMMMTSRVLFLNPKNPLIPPS